MAEAVSEKLLRPTRGATRQVNLIPEIHLRPSAADAPQGAPGGTVGAVRWQGQESSQVAKSGTEDSTRSGMTRVPVISRVISNIGHSLPGIEAEAGLMMGRLN